jgi:hypothetical protein
MERSSSPLNRLRRVASMGMTEAGYRSWQESSKWIERRHLDRLAIDPPAVLRREAPSIASRLTDSDAINAILNRHFFAGAAPESITAICRLFPEEYVQIQEDADRLLDGRFDLLGYEGLSFGTPIDWQLDPTRSLRAPLVHWSEIDHLNPAVVGDSKIAWELNRHQWIVRLAQAFAITRDQRYAAAAVHTIEEWIEANPVGCGLNWASSLEAAFRLIAWTWTLALLRDSGALSPAFMTRLLASVHAHAAHIRKYLSYYFSPNTHLTGEALGLFYAGTMFPHFRDAADWRSTGAGILIEQSRIQISDDGVYFEQSTGYQRYTCEFYLHFMLLAGRNGIAVPGEVRARVVAMIDFLAALRRPDGTMPLIGDTDDGWLLPLARRQPDDFRGLFATAAAVFHRSDYARAAGHIMPEVVWLLGRDGEKQFEDVAHAATLAAKSRVFPRGGYAVMRGGRGRDTHQLTFDVGPLGCPVSCAHGHADLLAIECSIFGDAVIVDPGTYGYTGEPEWRDYFRSAAAHSTVTVDGVNQSEPQGPFRWGNRPRAVLREWISTSELDLADGEHNAYVHLERPVVHRRRVVFVKPAFWLVIDDLTGDGSHGVEVSWQFAPLPAALTEPGCCRVDTERGSVLWMLPFAGVPLTNAIKSGDLAPKRGWISKRYGQKQPAPALVCSTTADLPLRIVTVLFPTRDRREPPPLVETATANGQVVAVRTAGYLVGIEPDHVHVNRS